MPLTIIDRRTTLTKADSVTGWTSNKTPTLYTSAPTPAEQTGCVGVTVSTETAWLVFGTSSMNFSHATGSLIYVWVLANGIMDTVANGGIGIALGDATNLVGYHIAGSDKSAFRHSNGSVGWQCLVLDTAKLPAQKTTLQGASASLNMAAITRIGAQFKTLAKAVGGVENCFVDTIRYGNEGLVIYGGTSGSDPGTFEQLAAEDVSTTSGKAYGIVRKLGTKTYGVQGKLTFGHTGSGDTWFEDTNATILFEDNGLMWNKYQIDITGTLTNNTTFILGKKTGTGESAAGSDGCVVQVPPSASARITATDVGVDRVGIYGSTIVGFKEGISFTSTVSGSSHDILNSTFKNNGQVDLGRVVTRNTVFTAYTSSKAAVLWNSDINIKNCTFNLNTDPTVDPAGIEHTLTGTFTYDNLKFSGNDYDVLNSTTGSVVINASNGSNPATSRNPGVGSSTTINNSVTHTVTGLQTNSRVIWIRVSDDVELANQTEVLGNASYTYNYAGDTDVDVQIISIGYKNKIIRTTLTNASVNLPAGQESDRFYFNPA